MQQALVIICVLHYSLSGIAINKTPYQCYIRDLKFVVISHPVTLPESNDYS